MRLNQMAHNLCVLNASGDLPFVPDHARIRHDRRYSVIAVVCNSSPICKPTVDCLSSRCHGCSAKARAKYHVEQNRKAKIIGKIPACKRFVQVKRGANLGFRATPGTVLDEGVFNLMEYSSI